MGDRDPTLNERWNDRRVLVTGGSGFLGRHLTHVLAQRGARVTVARYPDEPAPAWPSGVTGQPCDVRDAQRVQQLTQDVAPEIVFHLAAVGVNEPFIAPERALDVNVRGTLNVLQAVRVARGLRRIIVVGTCYEYGPDGGLDPGNVYAASKVAAWAFCRVAYRAYGTPVVVARPFNVYGPGQHSQALIPAAIQAALEGRDFPTTPGEQRRDFLYVNDLIRGFLALALADGIEGQSLDLGTGVATPVREVVKRIFTLAALRQADMVSTPNHQDCGDRASGQPQIGALPYRPGVVWELVADAERTARLTGWRAQTGLDQGLQYTIAALDGAVHGKTKHTILGERGTPSLSDP